MKCDELEKHIKSFLDKREADKTDVQGIVTHLKQCRLCRENYRSILKGSPIENVFPQPPVIKAGPVVAGKEPNLLKPVEFKDKPIKFTLILDGVKKPIKVVETDFDTPLPEDSRLVVSEKEVYIADVRFRFEPDRQFPYVLHYQVCNRRRYQPPKIRYFGPLGKAMCNLFRETILDEGGVRADVEMNHGKARLHIRYHRA